MKPASFHTPDACTACTICVAHCPVAKATMHFRGPKLTGPAYERFRLFGFGDDDLVGFFFYHLTSEVADDAYGDGVLACFQQSGAQWVDAGRVLVGDVSDELAIDKRGVAVGDAAHA